MAAETDNFKLIQPENGEYEDVWDQPFNENMEKIDSAMGTIRLEVLESRFQKASLKAFLSVGHNPDGTLKPAIEVGEARSSRFYGFQTAISTPTDFTLSQRLEQSEGEIFAARRGEASLEASLAKFQNGQKNKVIDGSKDLIGYPTYLGSISDKVLVDGSVVPLLMQVGGYFTRERILREVTVADAAGLRYIMATRSPSGSIVLDQDSSTAPPTTASGIISSDPNVNPVYLNDITQDFIALNIKSGDTLRVVGTIAAGDYIIKEVAPDGVATRLSIYGKFTLGTLNSLSGINYLVIDELSTILTAELTDTSSDTALCIGEADFDGVAVTDVRPRHFGDTFVSEWRAIDVAASPTFEEIFSHGLGANSLDVTIQVSQSSTGDGDIEELSRTRLTNNLAVAVSSSQSIQVTSEQTLTPGVFNPGSTNATMTQPVLAGSTNVQLAGNVSGVLAGTVVPESSAVVKWDRNLLYVKNALAAHFYRDYDGNLKTGGFIRVVVQRKG